MIEIRPHLLDIHALSSISKLPYAMIEIAAKHMSQESVDRESALRHESASDLELPHNIATTDKIRNTLRCFDIHVSSLFMALRGRVDVWPKRMRCTQTIMIRSS